MEMNEGARRANEDIYRRSTLSRASATNDKLDTIISLLEELLERVIDSQAHHEPVQTGTEEEHPREANL